MTSGGVIRLEAGSPLPACILPRTAKMRTLRWIRPGTWLRPTRAWLSGRPRLLASLVTALALILLVTVAGLVWFAYDITAGLPDRTAIRGLGEMAQATTIFDAHDVPVFTIFKEQRIEV